MREFLVQMMEWSAKTFGPGRRTQGLWAHVEKEKAEIRADPTDLEEWIDLIILACDGFWRNGGTPDDLLGRLFDKLEKNKAREWPAVNDGATPMEHVRRPCPACRRPDDPFCESGCPVCGGTGEV